MTPTLVIHRADGATEKVPPICRIDTLDVVEYYKAGGILQYVMKKLRKAVQAVNFSRGSGGDAS